MATSVMVLMGGWSSEREVSLVSGKHVAGALAEAGYDVATHDLGRDMPALIAALTPLPDVIFNALHGRFGEDGTVQGLLELLGARYTHSGVLASALAMDKPMAKRLFVDVGLPVPNGRVVARESMLAGDPMPRPYVIKPLNEGSSVGVIIVGEGDNAIFADEPWHYGEEVLVEEYVAGREITVAVMDGKALGALEIAPRQGFYDYDAKYTEGRADHLLPAPIPEKDYDEALKISAAAHRTLGCRGVSRADLRYDDSDGGRGLRLLEINTQPGMTPLSLVPEIAAHAGYDFSTLVQWMVEDARCGD